MVKTASECTYRWAPLFLKMAWITKAELGAQRHGRVEYEPGGNNQPTRQVGAIPTRPVLPLWRLRSQDPKDKSASS